MLPAATPTPSLCLGVLAAFGATIAQARGLPLLLLEPTPLLPTRAFPAPGWPLQRNLGGWLNRLSGAAMLRVLWSWYAPGVNAVRARLGLPGASAASFAAHPAHDAADCRLQSLPHSAPADDWPEHVHITGYLFLEERTTMAAAARSAGISGSGPPPVFHRLWQHGRTRPRATCPSRCIEALAGADSAGCC
jgi:sterol 3beta-glucosyltransferase